MKKVLIISCFFKKNETCRAYLAYKYFSQKFDTKLVYSDFSHWYKEKMIFKNNDFIPVNSISYSKNFSFRRIFSHIHFALNIKKIILKQNPDIIYIAIPPNISGYVAIKFAKKKNIKTIVDIIDIWPESMPIPNFIKKIFNFSIGFIWKYFRQYSLNKCDYIISESEYFIKKIKMKSSLNSEVIHLCKLNYADKYVNKLICNNEEIIIGYLGSITNIYDFDSLIYLCKKLQENRKLILYIIGDGERKNWLIQQLEKFEIRYKYFGKVFDENEKFRILEKCTFGFNGYKESTEVALSYKSIDYMSYGIPIINSAKDDTWELIEKENIGLNYNRNKLDSLVKAIQLLTDEQIIEMKQNCYNVFLSNFTMNVYIQKMDSIIQKIR